jgi:hypothetical protein
MPPEPTDIVEHERGRVYLAAGITGLAPSRSQVSSRLLYRCSRVLDG